MKDRISEKPVFLSFIDQMKDRNFKKPVLLSFIERMKDRISKKPVFLYTRIIFNEINQHSL